MIQKITVEPAPGGGWDVLVTSDEVPFEYHAGGTTLHDWSQVLAEVARVTAQMLLGHDR